MKKLFSYKRLECYVIKGFVFGAGYDKQQYVVFIGPLLFEIDKKIN
jgi:hypothetical protein